MTGFPVLKLIYGLLVMAALVLPYVYRAAPSKGRSESAERLIAFVLAIFALGLTILRGQLLIEAPFILILLALRSGLPALLGTVAAILLFLPATWWLPLTGIVPVQRLVLAGFCLVLALATRQARFTSTENGQLAWRTGRGRAIEPGIVFALLCLGLGAGLLTGAANETDAAEKAWHHWGAYISPVTALLSGGVPYRDFPVQYGLGPTLLLAAACSGGCWSGMYTLTVWANAFYLAACGWSILLLTRGMDGRARGLALAALACAAIMWTGNPLGWRGAFVTPSVGGLRFLPLAILLALILTAEQREQESGQEHAALSRTAALTGHAIWLCGLLWSPETALFTSLLWWPYLALRRADAAPDRKAAWFALMRGGLLGLAALLVGHVLLALLFRLIFGNWFAIGDYLLYLRYPPGPMPVGLLGPVWFVAAILLLAFRAVCRSGEASSQRSLYACLLAALAVLSYFLSRSHDNNILNLLPFLVILLVATQHAQATAFGNGFVRTTLIAVIAFTATFNFHSWNVRPGATSLAGLQLGSAPLTARYWPSAGQSKPIEHEDASALFSEIRKQGAGEVLMLDKIMIMPIGDPRDGWTGVNNLANFGHLPRHIVRRYIRQGAQTYRRPGWIIADRQHYGPWLDNFRTAYDVTEMASHGSYSAYRLVPRPVQHD